MCLRDNDIVTITRQSLVLLSMSYICVVVVVGRTQVKLQYVGNLLGNYID